tara:strand:- start:818 stop:2680 length:1863 start_codon:yes stop_codon:yes gene_type:complete
MLRKYIFKPGIRREGTEYSEEGGWYNSDKIRFRSGLPEKIGGWVKDTLNTFLGTCRSLHSWKDAAQTKYLGVGTHLKWYAKEGNTFSDITPLRSTTSAGDVTFSATNGSSTITATDSSHGAQINDFVTFSGAASLGGNVVANVLNQEYRIVSVTTNTFTFTAKDTSGDTVTANSSDSGNGGSSVVGAYQINAGLDMYVPSTGFGVGTWDSSSTWGSASALDSSTQLRIWSQDNFGDDLIGSIRLGGIYYWDESSGLTTRAVPFSGLSGASDAPVKSIQIMVSDIDRHIICFGSNAIGSTSLDPLLVRWSDQESAIDWTPTSTNTAGGQVLSSGSLIVGALRTRQEILIWTDAGVHTMRFVGAPFIFAFNEIAQGPSLVAPKACVNADNKVFFMDRGGFYFYSGSVQALPCAVQDYIFSDLNQAQAYKIFATSNVDKNEVMWFYPSSSSDEIDRYVIYNYLENVWAIGTNADSFTRTSWIEAHSLDYPLATGKTTDSDSNYLYQQEVGDDADGSALSAFIETADFDLEPDGDRYMFIDKIIPDLKFKNSESADEVTVTVKGTDYPLTETTTLSTSAVTPSFTQAYIRARTRQAILRFSSSGAGFGWRLGAFRINMRPDGRK